MKGPNARDKPQCCRDLHLFGARPKRSRLAPQFEVLMARSGQSSWAVRAKTFLAGKNVLCHGVGESFVIDLEEFRGGSEAAEMALAERLINKDLHV